MSIAVSLVDENWKVGFFPCLQFKSIEDNDTVIDQTIKVNGRYLNVEMELGEKSGILHGIPSTQGSGSTFTTV